MSQSNESEFVEVMYKCLREYSQAQKLADMDDSQPKVLTVANIRHMAATELKDAHQKAITAAFNAGVDAALEALPENDTDCGLDYLDNGDGCTPEDHMRRDARFWYKKEAEESIEEVRK